MKKYTWPNKKWRTAGAGLYIQLEAKHDEKIFIILALLAATVAASGMINKPKPAPVYITATAGAYSTTWELACKLAQEYGDERDVRAIIYDAQQLNPGMNLNVIQPGQKIKFRLEPEK